MLNFIGTMSKAKLGEWLWRFLALVMMFSVGWMGWIIYQLNPPPLILSAAFEAAANAKGKGTTSEKQGTQGVIAPSSSAEGVSKAPESPAALPPAPESSAALPPAPEAPKEPPVNPEKLKFSETLALPVPNAKK